MICEFPSAAPAPVDAPPSETRPLAPLAAISAVLSSSPLQQQPTDAARSALHLSHAVVEQTQIEQLAKARLVHAAAVGLPPRTQPERCELRRRCASRVSDAKLDRATHLSRCASARRRRKTSASVKAFWAILSTAAQAAHVEREPTKGELPTSSWRRAVGGPVSSPRSRGYQRTILVSRHRIALRLQRESLLREAQADEAASTAARAPKGGEGAAALDKRLVSQLEPAGPSTASGSVGEQHGEEQEGAAGASGRCGLGGEAAGVDGACEGKLAAAERPRPGFVEHSSLSIGIAVLHAETTALTDDSAISIGDDAAQVQDDAGLALDQQRSVFAGRQLEDGRTLSDDRDFQSEARLQVDHAMQIFIKTLSGKTITLEVAPSDTVHDTVAKIERKGLVPLEQQRLTSAGRPLSAPRSLSSYDISSASTLIVVPRLLGGADSSRAQKRRRISSLFDDLPATRLDAAVAPSSSRSGKPRELVNSSMTSLGRERPASQCESSLEAPVAEGSQDDEDDEEEDGGMDEAGQAGGSSGPDEDELDEEEADEVDEDEQDEDEDEDDEDDEDDEAQDEAGGPGGARGGGAQSGGARTSNDRPTFPIPAEPIRTFINSCEADLVATFGKDQITKGASAFEQFLATEFPEDFGYDTSKPAGLRLVETFPSRSWTSPLYEPIASGWISYGMLFLWIIANDVGEINELLKKILTASEPTPKSMRIDPNQSLLSRLRAMDAKSRGAVYFWTITDKSTKVVHGYSGWSKEPRVRMNAHMHAVKGVNHLVRSLKALDHVRLPRDFKGFISLDLPLGAPPSLGFVTELIATALLGTTRRRPGSSFQGLNIRILDAAVGSPSISPEEHAQIFAKARSWLVSHPKARLATDLLGVGDDRNLQDMYAFLRTHDDMRDTTVTSLLRGRLAGSFGRKEHARAPLPASFYGGNYPTTLQAVGVQRRARQFRRGVAAVAGPSIVVPRNIPWQTVRRNAQDNAAAQRLQDEQDDDESDDERTAALEARAAANRQKAVEERRASAMQGRSTVNATGRPVGPGASAHARAVAGPLAAAMARMQKGKP